MSETGKNTKHSQQQSPHDEARKPAQVSGRTAIVFLIVLLIVAVVIVWWPGSCRGYVRAPH